MQQETLVHQAFQTTAGLFRALGVSQDTASRELGLRGHTSFSFWKTGEKEFESRYAENLYKLIIETVNASWPHRPAEQAFVTRKLVDVIGAWSSACVEWQKAIHDTTQKLRHAIARLEQYGDASQLSYLQERQRIVHEIALLSESLQHVMEFQGAWEREGRNLEAVLEEKERCHLQTKAAQPPARQKGPRHPARRPSRRRQRV